MRDGKIEVLERAWRRLRIVVKLYGATGNVGNGDIGRGEVGRKDVEICGGHNMVSFWHWSGIVAKGTVSDERRVTGVPLLLDKFVACSLEAYGYQHPKK